ncbi:hypothetical protein CLV35_3569 [Motilibacter peucedani]|uniref:Uncharacterized protein n=1 Tax=Motilibacter peucedani TaxID=598650 RepID=A0A420XL52_9ACTN|nr:hypothetical protein CLV35_3569 [Motilibacter peucedani]
MVAIVLFLVMLAILTPLLGADSRDHDSLRR